MDELKLRAGEKIEALQVAAKTAAGTSKSRIQDAVSHTLEAIRKIKEAFHNIWEHELITEGRLRVVAWSREAIRRLKEGAPPLSPVLLYEELVTLFKDRVWRRSMMIFVCGAALGGVTGLVIGLRAGHVGPSGPHARALHSHADQGVILVEDAVASCAGAGEVLIRVQAFSVCCADRCVLRGHGSALRTLLGHTSVTVGRGFAGVVLDIGHGVSELELGDEVWGCLSEWSGGAASELLTVRSTRVSKRPRSLAADSAASVPWCGAQVLQALHALQYTSENCKGKRVAICGANSGEGCMLVQLLRGWGAHVTVIAPHQAAFALRDLGAHEFIEYENSTRTMSWAAVERSATHSGPWDCVVACDHAPPGPPTNPQALLRATAPRRSVLELRPRALLSDRLPPPLSLAFALALCTARALRWVAGCGWHTDWLEDQNHLSPGLQTLAHLIDAGELAPVLDKVYLPQDFEAALAHACSEDALGTTVVRFP